MFGPLLRELSHYTIIKIFIFVFIYKGKFAGIAPITYNLYHEIKLYISIYFWLYFIVYYFELNYTSLFLLPIK